MSLKEMVRQRFEDAKRTGKREDKDLLSVILGDISTAEARSGKEIPEAEVEKILRKMVESNSETLAQLKSHARADDPRSPVLEREIVLLKSLLPQTAGADDIARALEPVRAEIVNAKNDGQATGVAMKHLKAQGVRALGQDVSAAVQALRAGT